MWLIFKMFFMLKCIKTLFFYFKKIIFEISASKHIKKLIFNKTKKKLNFFKIQVSPCFWLLDIFIFIGTDVW